MLEIRKEGGWEGKRKKKRSENESKQNKQKNVSLAAFHVNSINKIFKCNIFVSPASMFSFVIF